MINGLFLFCQLNFSAIEIFSKMTLPALCSPGVDIGRGWGLLGAGDFGGGFRDKASLIMDGTESMRKYSCVFLAPLKPHISLFLTFFSPD
jgi:hypothetical protein